MGYPDQDKESLSLFQSNPHYATKPARTPCVGQNNSTKSVSYKHPRKFCAQSLPMVELTLCLRSDVESSKGVENPCVGGSIPPRATKNHWYVPDTCFTSGTDHMVYTFTNHIPNTLGPNGFSRACTLEDSISK